MQKFSYDMFNTITPPTLILSTKYHKHLGAITNVGDNTANDFNMASHQELSFDVYKTLDGVECELWDSIVDFKYVYVPEHNEYYELQISIDDADNTIKHCVCTSAGECELSQRQLRDFHCNDETDITYTPRYQVIDGVVSEVDKNGVVDFEYDDNEDDKLPGQDVLYTATVLYRKINATDSTWLKKKKERSSLLHRVLHDKCPDWSVGHVDDTLANIQRTFTADGTTIYDFLTNSIANELGCFFKFDSVNRKINVYDLKNTCVCGFRGEFVDKCPKCGSKEFIRGYGAWRNVYVSPENTALQITVDGDADSVKNCFKIVGGDDLMTATVVNINPNKSPYIYRFSDDMKADMPTELVDKLEDYETLYRGRINYYTETTNEWYDHLEQVAYLQTTMMPETPLPSDTTAEEQLNTLMNTTFTVAVENLSSASADTINRNVQSYAKVLVDPRYTVETSDYTVTTTSLGKRWTGKFTVKSLGGVNAEGEPDEATSTTTKNVSVNNDYEEFLRQKIEKTLDRTDLGLMTIFKIEDEVDFAWALHSYSLDRLNSFSDTYQAILEVLIGQKVGEKDRTVYGIDVYNEVYVPYYNRKQAIDREARTRKEEVDAMQRLADRADTQRKKVQAQLDLPAYLGDELYSIFLLYLREDTYTNSNYISDGFSNVLLIDRARELFTAAESELVKASELQFTLTGQLANFLNTEEFKDFKDDFVIGDYIICKADEKLYRLRITNVNYSYDAPEDISITFSNVVRGGNFMSDVTSVLSRASSMATSYNYVAHQASQGNSAKGVVNDFMANGVNSSVYNIIAGKNQDVVIDDHGITAREYDDTQNAYSGEELKITSHSLAFTTDNWASASLSLGKQDFRYFDDDQHQFVDATQYGLAANFVQAGYIWGSQIVSGKIYSQNYIDGGSRGAFINLDDGYFTFADGRLKFDANGLTIAGDIEDGSVINNAVINNSAINNANKFILTDGGNLTLNGTVSGTAWATKQDKLTAGTNITIDNNNVISATGGGTEVIVNPSGTPIGIMNKISVDGDIYAVPTYSDFVGSTASANGSSGLVPAPLIADRTHYLMGDGTWDEVYREITKTEYNALTPEQKNNDTIYFIKDGSTETYVDDAPLLGEYYMIKNEMLEPTYNWNNQIKWFFNQYDYTYCATEYGLDYNMNIHAPYGHSTDAGNPFNVRITSDMPVGTHHCVVVYASTLWWFYTFWIPKHLIDERKVVLTYNGLYSTESFDMTIITCNNSDWDDVTKYSAPTTYTVPTGFFNFNVDQYTHEIAFSSCPLMSGLDMSEPKVLEYIETGEEDPYDFYNVNYFTLVDGLMTMPTSGKLMLNSVNYSGNADGLTDVMVNNSSVVQDGVAYIDLTNYATTTALATKQDLLTAGTNIHITGSTISADKGSDVEANPSGTATATLTAVDIDGVIYDIQGGGGGTTVIPNPQGTPTDTLSTIQIGNDIFDIEGGGSGGGSGYTTTLLYDSGSLVNGAPYGQDVALLDNLSNYDMALLILGNPSDLGQANTAATTTAIIDTSFTLTDSAAPYYDFHWAGYERRWMITHFTDTTFNIRQHGGDVNETIYRIYGIKFSGGGGSYAETVIYENTGSTQASSMTLTDDIVKYDLILFEAYVSDDNRIYTVSNIYRASTIISGWNTTLLRWSPSNQYINLGYVSSTELTCYASSNMYIKRIVGLKCSGSSLEKDISDMTWTLLASTTGVSSATPIPNDTKHLVLTCELNGIVSMVADESIANINKLLDVSQLSSWNKGYEYYDTAGNHTNISMTVNNGNVTIKSGYPTVTAKVYSLV